MDPAQGGLPDDTGNPVSYAQVNAAYQKYLGRNATAQDYAAWAGNLNYDAEIAASPEAQQRAGGTPGGPPPLGTPPTAPPGYTPPAATPPPGQSIAGASTPENIKLAYRYFLGREATPLDIQAWIGNPDYLAGIQNSPEAQARRQQTNANPKTGTPGLGNFADIPGFDPGKLRDPNKKNAKYTDALRIFSQAIGAMNLAPTTASLQQIVDFAKQNGFQNAKVVGSDSIDFGDGYGPVDVIKDVGGPGANWQMLQHWNDPPPGFGDQPRSNDQPGGLPGGFPSNLAGLGAFAGGGQLPGGFPSGLGGGAGTGMGGYGFFPQWAPPTTPFNYQPLASPSQFNQGAGNLPFGGSGSAFNAGGMPRSTLLTQNAFMGTPGQPGPSVQKQGVNGADPNAHTMTGTPGQPGYGDLLGQFQGQVTSGGQLPGPPLNDQARTTGPWGGPGAGATPTSSVVNEYPTQPWGETAPATGGVGGVPAAPVLQYTPYQREWLTAHPITAPAPFQAPTLEEAKNDPGYQFALQQQLGAQEHSAAAKGLLHSVNTIKGLGDYAQQSAAQQYNNVFARDIGVYGTNAQLSQAAALANQQNALQTDTANLATGITENSLNNQNAYTFGNANFQNALQGQGQGYQQAVNNYQMNFTDQLQAQNQQFNQGLAAWQANNGYNLNAYQAEQAANLGWGNLGLGYQQAANQYELGQGNLGLGYYNAANNYALGQGNLGLGYYNAANQYALGQGNLGLGYYNAANTYNLGLGNLALGQQQAANQYNLGLGNLGLGWGNLGLASQNQNFNQDLATWQANLGLNNQQFNQFLTLAQLGLTANGQIGAGGTNFANMLSQLFGSAGNSNAGATVGQNNAWQAWLGQLANMLGGFDRTAWGTAGATGSSQLPGG